MTAFADPSALVKLYADEPGHRLVRSFPVLVVSQLARVEVPAAIWRKHRAGQLTAAQAGVLVADFEADYFGTGPEPARFVVAAVSGAVLETAARVARLHGLRAYDSVQLATAQHVVAAAPECHTFAAFDERLCAAAGAEGFNLLPTT
jgi:predicted nucleic acid-binding protein